jgi:hypothetical protein
MARPKGSHDIASKVRGAFLRALKQSEEDKRPLSTIMLEMLQTDPKACLDTVAKFVPKEMLIEQSIEVQLAEMSDEAIAGEIERLIAGRAAAGVSDGSGKETQH